MGRKYAGEYTLGHGSGAVWAALPAALADCGFEITESSDTELVLHAKKRLKNVSDKSVPMGDRRTTAKATWGEKLDASVHDEGGGSRVRLESRLVFGLIDWGENRRNVEGIRAALDVRLAPPG